MKIVEFLDKILESEESKIYSQVESTNTLHSHKLKLARKAAKRKGLNYDEISDDTLSNSKIFWTRLNNKAKALAEKDYQDFLNSKIEAILSQARTLKIFGLFEYDFDDLQAEVVEFVKKYYNNN